jgi:hypothetical protein
MNPALKKFIGYCLLTGSVLIVGTLSLNYLTVKHLDLTPVYFVVFFVMVITILFHLYLLRVSKGDSKTFISKFMASSGLKLMIYLTVIVVYIVSYRLNAKVFLTSFLISYFVFSVIEVIFILTHLKK